LKDALRIFEKTSQELTDLRSVSNALAWDQETVMPSKGSVFRARQAATVAAAYHQKLVDPIVPEVLDSIATESLDEWGHANLSELRREYEKAVRMPKELVEELAETAALAYPAWVKARKESDFPSFAPWLEKILELKRQEARCLQNGNSLYEALLDDFEPHMSEAILDRLFAALRPELTALTQRIQGSSKQPNDEILQGHFPIPLQEKFGKEMLSSIGFDWEAGRVDRSPHPFCSGVSPNDVRITTRYSEKDFSMALFGMIHEAGHGLYEQGLDTDRFGMLACQAISLGIHESQSRLWEIFVGRSSNFWRHWYPKLQVEFSPSFDSVKREDFVHAINKVTPSMIRVEADEVTYGLHVILRYEIEKELLQGHLEVGDLEEAWNQKTMEYVGLRPKSAAEGVLQDVHWSHGLIGYFPTYLLGTVYAAQMFQAASESLQDLPDQISNGETRDLLDWLREKVHRVGRTKTAAELVGEISGKPLQADCLLKHLKEKFTALYEL
jgi:carboxypeptidase Taq